MGNTEELIKKYREKALELSNAMMVKHMEGSEVTDEEKKHLKNIKSELKFMEKTYLSITGKKVKETGKSTESTLDEVLSRVKNLQSSVGDIVCAMPKN